jgi:hypothetical protein
MINSNSINATQLQTIAGGLFLLFLFFIALHVRKKIVQ